MDRLTFVVLHHSTDYFHIMLLENCLKSIRVLYPKNRILVCKTSESILPSTIQEEFCVEIRNTPQDGSTVFGGIYSIVTDPTIDNYVLMHDSIYLLKELPETVLEKSLYYLWHFDGIREDHIARFQTFLSFSKFTEQEKQGVLDIYNNDLTWKSCFGGCLGGSRATLITLADKLNIVDNIHAFSYTPDIMCFERYLACAIQVLQLETPFEGTYSLNGSIFYMPYAGRYPNDYPNEVDLNIIKKIPYAGYMYKLYLSRSLVK